MVRPVVPSPFNDEPVGSMRERMTKYALSSRPSARMTEFALKEPVKHETLSPEEGFDFWVRYFIYRIKHEYDAIELITGDEGRGKSTYALRKAKALTRGKWNPENLCYSAEDVLKAYQRAKKGTVIIYDEAVRGLLSSETFEAEQRALIKLFALVREKGVILLLCAPSIWLVAKQVRSRRATLWTHITERGEGRVFERDVKLTFKPSSSLRFAESPMAPRVTWEAFDPKDPFFQRYSKVKTARLAEYFEEALLDIEESKEHANKVREKREKQRVKFGATTQTKAGPPSGEMLIDTATLVERRHAAARRQKAYRDRLKSKKAKR